MKNASYCHSIIWHNCHCYATISSGGVFCILFVDIILKCFLLVHTCFYLNISNIKCYSFYMRKQLCSQRVLAVAILSVCPSVYLSVHHTGGSGKNGAS